MNSFVADFRTADVAHGDLLARYARTRADTERLAARLSAEDQNLQSMADASPTKWHRAHTTWFFETFVLKSQRRYREFAPGWGYLFNSYYEAIGARHPRAQRGLLSRPSVDEIAQYRSHVDEAMHALMQRHIDPEMAALIELGLHHEQQHQELLLTDILHAFAQNILRPAYFERDAVDSGSAAPLQLIAFEGGLVSIGHDGSGFAFDNETPRHKVFLEPFLLANRPVTNGEWVEFIEAGGYRKAQYWLADGWAKVNEDGWTAPLYWQFCDGVWCAMTLSGLHRLDLSAPVAHVSYYEADAYARFRDMRLPTEAEWEFAASDLPVEGNLRDERCLCPLPASHADTGPMQMFGDVWEWTASSYSAYPGFRPGPGAVGEYNGKFMVNQMVLRGGSCVTPPDHIRGSYRNFFYPHQRWQFSGLRLANDVRKEVRVIQGGKAQSSEFQRDVLSGLTRKPKTLPAKYFYDDAGSRLFERICTLPEYYLTRTELALLKSLAPSLAEVVQPGTVLVEFGCGSSAKPRILLDVVRNASGYVPIDICGYSLSRMAAELARAYPHLDITPITGDFLQPLSLPSHFRGRPLLGFFPGSTIGNFEEKEAGQFLSRARELLHGGRLLIGFDLAKDVDVLLAAYDDSAGVTAAFNKNMLVRINRELKGDFELDAFAHRAFWNAPQSRIEMHLESLCEQEVHIGGRPIVFGRGETIHTENSHKYEIGRFEALAAKAGWRIEKSWINLEPEFAVLLLA